MDQKQGAFHGVTVNHLFMLIAGSFLLSLGINIFIAPGGLYAGGVTGLLQLLTLFVYDLTQTQLSLGLLIFVVNLPLFYIAWEKLGKRFAILTIFAVAMQTLFLEFIPVLHFSYNTMLNVIFGGVLMGIGTGLTLKIGASGGGMDIVGQLLSYKYDGGVGKYSTIINIFIILIAGFYQEWEIAMYTLIAIYIAGVVVDRIHTIHKNVTLYIVTKKRHEITAAIWAKMFRGITVLPAIGAYSEEEKEMLMLVVSSYELYDAVDAIKQIDDKVWINVVNSEAVIGFFNQKRL